MRGREHVVHVLAVVERLAFRDAVDHLREPVENLDARLLQLHAHGDRERSADDPRDDREDQVHRADVLVVGRVDVALPAGWMGGVRVVHCCGSHRQLLAISLRRP